MEPVPTTSNPDSSVASMAASLMDVALGTLTRPSWRGRLHMLAVLVAAPLMVVMAWRADGTRARVGVLIYAGGLCAMFLVSATYHRWAHTLRARAAWRRADHATIYAAIAGTFTPVCLSGVGTTPAVALLIGVWVVAVVGAAIKALGWRHSRVVGGVLYLGIGWAGALIVPALWARGYHAVTLLLLLGGLVYTAGAIGFGRQWPRWQNPSFSFHEVWHSFTIAAAGLHLAAVWIITS